MSRTTLKPLTTIAPTKTTSDRRAPRARVAGGLAGPGMSVEGGLGEATRARLINAAGEVFAEVGFRLATVRDICARANVNIASVNYYFGDKAGLYAEVLRHTHATARAKYPLECSAELSQEDSLRVFVRMFMTKILDEGRPAWHGKLMAREMVEPTKALDEIVEISIRPTWVALTRIVAKLVAREPGDLLVRDCSASVIGQCLMFCHCRPVIDRLFPQSRYTPEQIARLNEHIVQFSLQAIDGLREIAPPRRGRSPKQTSARTKTRGGGRR